MKFRKQGNPPEFSDREPRTEEEWRRFLEDLRSANRASIRHAARRCALFSGFLVLAFIGLVLVADGMPLQHWRPIAGPVLTLVGFLALMPAVLYGVAAVSGWALGLGKKDDLSQRR